ncbi:heme-binding protein [Rhodococcus sp. 14-2470-1b]|uniref:GlcG/HbpS family heme-binding protein n=1 Tax=Rhodococcus sp. 14-2470-1b TaxID=2023149 RepID=UPI0011401365|nr:heme-binding protein [Rhodococcus sp. 14-2470-1b]
MTYLASSLELSTDALNAMIRAATDCAAAAGSTVSVHVVDSSAVSVAYLKMHGAHQGSGPLAHDKAWTTASFGGRGTEELGDWLVTVDQSTRDAILRRPRFTILPGGVPIWDGEVLVGAVGVSGGPGDVDVACARAALRAIGVAENGK